jgi:peptidylprolyl isomerase
MRGIALAIAALVLASAGCASARRSPEQIRAETAAMTFHPDLGITPAQAVALPSGVFYLDATVGTGAVVTRGSEVRVRYAAYLPDGRHVSGALEAEPITLRIEPTGIIRGWYEGMQGMRVGGFRRLIIPPELGYGDSDQGAIPRNSTLVFDVMLISVR